MVEVAVTFPAEDLPEDARATLVQGLEGHRVRFASSEGQVVFGQPPVDALTGPVRWVHVSSAGYGRYDPELLRARGITLTTSSSVYAQPVAESALAMLLAGLRRLPHTLAEQADRSWHKDRHRARGGLVRGSRIVLLGWGAIGQTLAPALQALGAQLVIVRHRVRGDEPLPTFPVEQLHTALAGADAVVSSLPGDASTTRVMDAAAFAQLAPGALFVNVGRGTTVDQDALLEAIGTRLSGAWLDVTDPEPLPADHPLWTTPNVWIAPHVAGGWRGESRALVEHFLANFARYQAGEPLSDVR